MSKKPIVVTREDVLAQLTEFLDNRPDSRISMEIDYDVSRVGDRDGYAAYAATGGAWLTITVRDNGSRERFSEAVLRYQDVSEPVEAR